MSKATESAPMAGGELTDVDDWGESWSDAAVTSIRFDPEIPIYRDIHRILSGLLPRDEKFRFLEIGAYPGYLMWYFNQYFGYEVSGIEFVPWCCRHANELLRQEGVQGDIIESDVFRFSPAGPDELWDVVASNGFVEHFEDTVPAMAKHISLTRPNGYIVIAVPNHSSIYGWVMKKVRPDRWKLHNLMTLQDALDALARAGDVKLVYSGYTGRFGFWASCLYETVKKRGRFAYFVVRAPLWLLEKMAQWGFPNSRLFSPSFLIVARRQS